MANEQVYKFKYIGDMDVSKIKTSIENLQKNLSSLNIPATALSPFEKTVKSLSEELKNFQVLTSKTSTNKSGMAAIEKSYEKIDKLIEKIGVDLEDAGRKGFDKLIPKQALDNIKEMSTQMKKFQSIQEGNEKTQTQINNKLKELAQKEQDVIEKAKEQYKIKKQIKELEKNYNSRSGDREIYKNELDAARRFIKLQSEINKYNKAKNVIDEDVKKVNELNEKIESATQKVLKYSQGWNSTAKGALALKEDIQKWEDQRNEVQANIKAQQNIVAVYEGTTQKIGELTEKIEEIDAETEKYTNTHKQLEDQFNKGQTSIQNERKAYRDLKETISNLKLTDFTKDLNVFRQRLAEIKGVNISEIPTDLKELDNVVKSLSQGEIDKIASEFKILSNSQEELSRSSDEVREKINQEREAFRNFDQRMKEVDSIKQRITAFFGLNNAIMLARRALRSAYDTVKELDKAMTETAVVTNFSVGDMWSQLPEYTKRANELGVTTLEAYQASTLFYQQGLKTNEVVALSNETLKMARIAGLDAAEATDRMTNALRGFNMTLTETNAQRIDDVYSKLAAITASNVDEISTAMTKVASLAHNANMEFETTSAFLAQIIETTRESAETAGTALKTVVARFSEVKDLYTKEELTGTDEEGEVIDVNKISKALRTAGIDLNRYFLGTVGLDDIFMELAEKWDSLTNVQQRYIATQAAGSRQQSRFIALMSDYARTQELVSAAYNANGAAAEQFEKTQESLQSKLARLKNAWDEFTMGLANSTLIKTGVELLTGVLTAVNKLTTGFGLLNGKVGSFVSALLKVGTVMGVRSLAKGPAAMLINSLGSVIGIGGVSNKEAYLRSVFRNDSEALGSLEGASWKSIFKQQFTGPLNNILNRRNVRADSFTKYSLTSSGYNIIGGLKNARDLTKFETRALDWGSKGFGKTKLAQGLGAKLAPVLGMGTSSAGAQAAAGIVSMGVALVAVAAAATAAYGAIKMLYDASPQGQIKYAEQVKSEIDHTKSSLDATKKTLDETLDSYNQQLDSLSKLQEGTIEWANAFIEVNKTVSDLIERFPELIKYVNTTSDGLLMLDQKGLAEYQKNLNEQIGKYSALSIMATGGVAQRKAIASQGAEAMGQEYLAEASFVAAAKSLTKGRYSEEIYKTFAKNFDFNKWAKDAGREAGSGTGKFLGIGTGGGTKKQLRDTYRELTGQEADENWNKNQLKDAIGQFNNIDEIESYLKTISDILNKIANGKGSEENKETAKNVLQGINDQNAFDFASGLTDFVFGENLKDTIGRQVFDEIAQGMNYDFSPDVIYKTEQSFKQVFDWYQALSGLTDEEIFDAVDKNTIAEAGLEILRRIFESAEEFNLTKEQVVKNLGSDYSTKTINAVTNFLDNIESLTNEEYSKLAPIFAKLQSSGIDVADTFGELTPEAIKILTALDLSDPDSVRMVFNALNDMEYQIDQNVVDKLFSLANAADAATKALEKIDKATTLAKSASELKTRESFTFNKEEYELYGQYDPENFYRISDDLWIYLEDDFNKLIQGLNNASSKIYEEEKNKLEQSIASGEQWKSLKNLGWSDGRIRLLFGGLADQYEEAYLNLDTNKKALKQLGNGLNFYGPVKELNNATDIKAVFNSRSSKELLKYYNQANNSLQEQIDKLKDLSISEERREIIAQKLALQYEEQVQELQEVSSAIKENKELLFSDNETEKQNAISAIANEIAKAYGISKEAAYDFVNEHKDIVSKAMETDAGYADFNKKLSETVFEYLVSQAGKSRQLEDSALESLKEEAQQTYNEILGILDNVPDEQTILIDANLSLLLQKLKEAEINIDDFMASLGYSLVPSIEQKRNPAWTSDMSKQDFIASGLGPPYLTTTTYTVKKIGTADIGGSPGGGSPGGSSKEPDKILQSDVLKEQFEREQEKRNVGEKTKDKDLVQNFIDKAPDWILDIIAELRKEAGLELGDMRTLEIQEGDTTEILEWLQKYYDAKAEQIPEDTTEEKLREQISDLEAERDYKEKEGASEGDLAEIDEKIVDSLEQLIAILVEQNNGKYNAEIWDLFSKLTDVQNRGNEELENWLLEIDRYYNLNNLLERLADTGQDLIDTIDDSFNNPDSSGKEIVTNIVKAADVFAEELSAELYKSEALNTDRQNLLNKGSKFAAAGLIQIDDSGIVRQIADNIYNLQDSDKELYEEFQQWTSELDSIDNDIRSNESAIKGTYSKFDSLRSSLQQAQSTYVDLLKRTVDALISVQQDAIDTQKAINDSLNETGRDIIDGMREQIDLERQIRDNTKTEEEIRDMESRLAYLRRDTTGANTQEIMKLEKQIAEKRENYQDKLVDQRLQELQKQQQDAEKARNFQTQAMQERLDEQIKQGAFNNEASRIIKNSIDENGNLINDSALVQILQQSENWDALSEEERDIITTALNQQVNGAAAWLMSKEDGGFQSVINDVLGKESPLYEWLSGGDEKSLPALINELLDGLTGFVKDELDQVNSEIENLKEMAASNNEKGTEETDSSDGTGNSSEEWQKIPTSYDYLQKLHEGWDKAKTGQSEKEFLVERLMNLNPNLSSVDANKYLQEISKLYKIEGFATGGLNTLTGPAWLDGTPSRPEYVLNADQTQAFLRLAEVLPSIMRGNTTNSVDSVKNIYLNLTMNVDEIADDYDVDQIADRVKEILYDAGTYRNVNMLSLN